ncbi:branched-chain alpha-ketoacid dehydrogenase [Pavlovales sp. CCMP2436]|nr:branched-chain alpha-ketoacid dehydrogenase [Pavlovales sp. CCMP2436]|mmetsp:Transcript_14202/g.36119  ORF Transcript_14202/g.36119 Transcript_14202/m.36119 type:complete len:513 (-) Transcript_14202:149-1687(-)
MMRSFPHPVALVARWSPLLESTRAWQPIEHWVAACGSRSISLSPRRHSSLASSQPSGHAQAPSGLFAAPASAVAPSDAAAPRHARSLASEAADSRGDEVRLGSLAFEALLDELAAQPPTAISLTNLWRVGIKPSPEQSLLNSQFLWRELRLRFAQRARQLATLPYGLSSNPSIAEATQIYYTITSLLVECPKPRTPEDEAKFAGILRETKPTAIAVPQKIGLGLAERARAAPFSEDEQRVIDKELDAFFMARIGHRFLIQHYLASKQPREGLSGIISGRCSPVEVCEDAAAVATRFVTDKCGTCPLIEIIGDRKHTFTYVPSHIYFIACELLKNACGATIRHRRNTEGVLPAGTVLPAVRVIVARGEQDIAIKIEDQGGGIARSKLADVWSYRGYWAKGGGDDTFEPTQTPTVGGLDARDAMHGLGLPLSRLYAKYFGGTLHLAPMEGYGTDCYVRLNRLGDQNCENLPPSVLASPGSLDSSEHQLAELRSSWRAGADERGTGSLFDAQARR